MEQDQDLFEHIGGDRARLGARLGIISVESGLYHLQVPVTVLMPQELIKRLRILIETIAVQGFGRVAYHALQAAENPAVGQGRRFFRNGTRGFEPFEVHQEQACRIPDLVHKVLVALDSLLRELDIAPLRGESGQGETERIRSIFVHHEQGIDHVALRFAHFLPLGIPDQRVHVHFMKRDFIHELNPHHHHAGHPEEQDVKSRDEYRGRIEFLQFRSLIGPAKGGKRPEAGTEPGVKHVGILFQCGAGAVRTPGRLFHRYDHIPALRAVPGRNAVPPPDLPADAPVLDVLHPDEVIVFPLGRNDPGLAAPNRCDGRFCQRLRGNEPLEREHRFQHACTPVAMADPVFVGLDLYKIPLLLQVLEYLLTAGIPVHPGIRTRLRGHHPPFVDYLDEFQSMLA